MLPMAFYLLLNSLYVALRVSSGGSFPKTLSPQEEKEYIERAYQGDDEAKNILIERNLRLVAHVMKKYFISAKDQEDLISIGTIGLIKAVNSFDPTKNIKLATYAGRCIENEILMYFRGQKKIAGEIMMFDNLENDGESNSLVLGDTLSDEDEEILDRLDREERCGILLEVMESKLSKREKEIIVQRYGIDTDRPLTQREIASKSGISRSYVSRIA